MCRGCIFIKTFRFIILALLLIGCSAGTESPPPPTTTQPIPPLPSPTILPFTVTPLLPTATRVTPTFTVAPPPGSVVYTNPQKYQVTYLITVYNKALEIDRLLVYQPRPVDWDAQENVQIESVSPSPTRESVDPIFGNGLYYWFKESEPAPGGRLDFEIRFSLTAYETVTDIDPELVQNYRQDDANFDLYTKSERFIEATNPRIIELADQIAGGETNPYFLARKYYDYVVDHARYKLLGEGLRGAVALVETDVGECGDFVSLFIALCRAAGIPSRPIVGYWAISGIDQTHVWAEFYLEPFGWIPVDPTIGQQKPSQRDYYFGNMDNQRVILNKGFNLLLDPLGPDNYVAPFLQVPLWWFWGNGNAAGTYLERTTWKVVKIP